MGNIGSRQMRFDVLPALPPDDAVETQRETVPSVDIPVTTDEHASARAEPARS